MYNSQNRAKYLLQVHLIFSTKYRKQILTGTFGTDLKAKIANIASRGTLFSIEYLETDKDHVHILVSHAPNISISQIVRKLKSETAYWAWQHYRSYLKEQYWKSKQLWTPAYFACSIGNVSKERLAEYIQNQG